MWKVNLCRGHLLIPFVTGLLVFRDWGICIILALLIEKLRLFFCLTPIPVILLVYFPVFLSCTFLWLYWKFVLVLVQKTANCGSGSLSGLNSVSGYPIHGYVLHQERGIRYFFYWFQHLKLNLLSLFKSNYLRNI